MAPQRNPTDDALENGVATQQNFGKRALSDSFAACKGEDTQLSFNIKSSPQFVNLLAQDRGFSFRSDVDYGLWDEGDLDECLELVEMIEESTHSMQSTSVSSITSVGMIPSPRIDDLSEIGISPVFIFENGRAPVCCRAFESTVSLRTLQVCVSLSGFRIVQSDVGEYAEFKVKMFLNDKEITCWKKFSQFEQLAEACREYSKVEIVQSWTTLFRPAPRPLKFCRDRSKTDFSDTLVAWERLMDARFWGWTLSHAISVQRLMDESQHLELFLKCILFEIPNADILVEFFCQM